MSHILGLGNINFSTWVKLGIIYFLTLFSSSLFPMSIDEPKKCNIATITINFLVYYLLLFLIPNRLHKLIANDNVYIFLDIAVLNDNIFLINAILGFVLANNLINNVIGILYFYTNL